MPAVAAAPRLGLRHPLQRLPQLFFEVLWKAAWPIAIARPLWSAHQIDADTAETVHACLMGIIVPVVIPWRYAIANYVRKPGDRWR